jgi:phosphopantothenoylcysteine decarboxylase/phosphopantothenate--cysteine ligase
VEVIRVRSANEMHEAVMNSADGASVVVMAAAVSDYRPESVAPGKIKKTARDAQLRLVRNPDILKSLSASKGGRFLVGFAAETEAVVENARAKLRDKNLDLIVANDVSASDRGFGSEENTAVFLDAAGGEVAVPLVSKRELAEKLWDRIAALRAAGRVAVASTR